MRRETVSGFRAVGTLRPLVCGWFVPGTRVASGGQNRVQPRALCPRGHPVRQTLGFRVDVRAEGVPVFACTRQTWSSRGRVGTALVVRDQEPGVELWGSHQETVWSGHSEPPLTCAR